MARSGRPRKIKNPTDISIRVELSHLAALDQLRRRLNLRTIPEAVRAVFDLVAQTETDAAQ